MPNSQNAWPPGGRSPRALSWLVSCEHGGANVPAAYARLFAGAARLLASHRGSDHGALEVARALAAELAVPLHASTVSRLLVDLNRSPQHRALFSERSARLTAEQKERLLAEHYWPYRLAVEEDVARHVAAGRFVVHISSHSFVPVLDGKRRGADIGLLYDPSRRVERGLAAAWRRELLIGRPELAVRRNDPYRGVADGLVTHLRRRFSTRSYAGLELEVNQRFVRRRDWPQRVSGIVEALARVVAQSKARTSSR